MNPRQIPTAFLGYLLFAKDITLQMGEFMVVSMTGGFMYSFAKLKVGLFLFFPCFDGGGGVLLLFIKSSVFDQRAYVGHAEYVQIQALPRTRCHSNKTRHDTVGPSDQP